MDSAHQLDLLGAGEPTADVPDAIRRVAAARAAAERLAGRIGLGLPAAVERAMAGAPSASALGDIARHVVRVVDAAADRAAPWSADAIDALHGRLPPVAGASPGILRAITETILTPDAAPTGG